MNPPKVTPLRPKQPAPAEPGAFGLHWTAEHQRDTHRWRIVGREHGRLVTCEEVRTEPGRVPARHLAWLTAQLLNDVGEDPANQMIAELFDAPEEP